MLFVGVWKVVELGLSAFLVSRFIFNSHFLHSQTLTLVYGITTPQTSHQKVTAGTAKIFPSFQTPSLVFSPPLSPLLLSPNHIFTRRQILPLTPEGKYLGAWLDRILLR